MKTSFVFLFILSFGFFTAKAQDFQVWNSTKFTWEGAFEGNKAIWKGGDSLNTYNVEGIDIKVAILDTFKMNTTPVNLSEFNDFTKSNAFFGRGSLALQMTSTNSSQNVCMEYAFQKPVVLEDFTIYDIDMKQNTANLPSSWQDSLNVYAYSQLGIVPVQLSYISETPAFVIQGQSAKARFRQGVDGDLRHTDPNGAVKLSTKLPIEMLKFCFANGSEDDGISNSHALKITEFKFKEVVGSISGSVSDRKNNKKLSGYHIRLIDPTTNLVIVNKNGDIMQTVTDQNGQFTFDWLPMGPYKIVKSPSVDYESDNDIDGVDDGTISVLLDLTGPASKDNDFYEKPVSPLPVKLSSVNLYSLGNQKYKLHWTAATETNCDFYTIQSSEDQKNIEVLGQVRCNNKPISSYSFDFSYDFKSSDVLYITLSQTDFDGTENELFLGKITGEAIENEITLSPNPFKDVITLVMANPDVFDNVNIIDVNGKRVITERVNSNNNTLNLQDLPHGVYYLQLTGKATVTKKIVKF
jgi:hypothetical protein